MLTLALALGLLIGAPQWVRTLAYLPKSVRSHQGYDEKTRVGSVPLRYLILGLGCPRLNDQGSIEGVYFTEIATYIGLLPLIFALCAPSWRQWMALIVFVLLSLGRFTPLFRLVHPLCLRIPARFTYFIALTLTFMAVGGLTRWQGRLPLLACLCLIQGWDLCQRTSALWPMRPFCQRTDRPSRLFTTALTDYLHTHLHGYRVSGLPYPLRTGQCHGFRTLGYNGASQLRAMATFRQDSDSNGGGQHDWFHRQPDSPALDWYGVKYAYTYRDLSTLWNRTTIQHLWENPRVYRDVPDFRTLERHYRA